MIWMEKRLIRCLDIIDNGKRMFLIIDFWGYRYIVCKLILWNIDLMNEFRYCKWNKLFLYFK